MIADLKPYSEYKESGVTWLGRVPLHWDVYAFRNLPRPQRGKQPKNLVPSPGEDNDCLPYLTMEYLRTSAGRPEVYAVNAKGVIKAKKEDIILLWDGANAGELLRAKDGIVCSTAALIPSGSFDNHFFYYILKQCEPCLRAFSVGMGIPHVDNITLKSVLIAVPPAIEQRSVARFLNWATGQLDKVIYGNKKTMKLLSEYKQYIIQNAVTRGLDQTVRLKPSGIPLLGEIPEHWKVVRNLALFSERKEPGIPGLPVLQVSLHTGVTSENNGSLGPHKRQLTDNAKYKLVRAGDLSYNTMRMWQGAVGVAPVDGCVSSAYVVIRPGRNVVSKYYEHVFRTDCYKHLVSGYSRGITPHRNRLYWESFKQMPIVCPPIEEQQLIVDSIELRTKDVTAAIILLNREMELLREYRTRLIADIVTGKLDVRDAAAHLPSEASEHVDDMIDIDEAENVADFDEEEAET